MSGKKKSIHYAWICCLAGMLLFFITVGLSGNVYSVYQPYFRDAFLLTESRLAFMNTSRQIAGIAAMAVLGLYYRKLSLKWGMVLAAFTTVVGFVFMAFASGYPMLLAGCLLTGFGNNLGGMVPISMMMDRWFIKDRSIAVSICSASSGIATFLAPKIITESIGQHGLTLTLAVQAGIMLFFTALCALLFCESPEKKNLFAYGEEDEAAAQAFARPDPPALPKLIWLLIYLMMFIMGGLSGCAIATLPLLAKSQGYSDAVMATSVSLAGIALLAGKLLFGWLSERITQYKTTLLYGFIMTGGLILLCFSALSPVLLYAGSILYIGTLAMIAIGLVTWVTDWVPERSWAKFRQRWQLVFNIGCLIFSIVPGILADRFGGSYLPTFYIYLGESVVCLIILFITYRASRR